MLLSTICPWSHLFRPPLLLNFFPFLFFIEAIYKGKKKRTQLGFAHKKCSFKVKSLTVVFNGESDQKECR